MIPAVIYVVDAIRSAFNKSGRGLSMLAEAFGEAQELRRGLRRKFRHMEE